jgi:hypothetical protein
MWRALACNGPLTWKRNLMAIIPRVAVLRRRSPSSKSLANTFTSASHDAVALCGIRACAATRVPIIEVAPAISGTLERAT